MSSSHRIAAAALVLLAACMSAAAASESGKAGRLADFTSPTWGYAVRSPGVGWQRWTDVHESAEGADYAALSADGYGMVVVPGCWQGAAPPAHPMYRMALQQFGEDYPSDFIDDEREVEKGAAAGRLFAGTDVIDGDEFEYHIALLANDRCAWLYGAWGPTSDDDLDQRLSKLWERFEVAGSAGAAEARFADEGERGRNAFTLNSIGLQLHAARVYRDAHRFFSEANALAPADPSYAVNAVQALAELDAWREAADWLTPRLPAVAGDPVARSWDAWLAYQLDEYDRAEPVYAELFATGYREDNDFGAYATILAEAGEWDTLDRAFADYSKGGALPPDLRYLEAELLARRGEHERALGMLDSLDSGRGFNADLAYARIDVYEAMNAPADVLRIAEELIANNYRSLESYFYKGSSEYRLQSYREARASFEKALEFAPGNSAVRDYLEAIDSMLGEGDVTLISQPVEPVPLPRWLEQEFDAAQPTGREAGYGAEYLARMKGLERRSPGIVVTTWYQKVHVYDDSGVENFSTLMFDFDAASEQLFVNALRVRNADGEVVAEGSLQSYFITNDEDGYEASTDRTAHLPVPKLAPGYSIEALVSKRTRVEEGQWPLETHYLAADRPIRLSAVFVRGDAGGIEYAAREVAAPERRDGALTWRVDDPVAYRWEPLQPYHDQILPWVRIGTIGRGWDAVGSDYLDQIRDKLAAEDVAERANGLVAGIDGTDRRIEVLSAYVQDEITYKALEFGRRAYIPKSARETLRDRYGDCKDHAVLLYAMLNAVGVDASLALVNLSEEVSPELPNTDQFDHMVVAVPTEAGLRFIDTTDKDLRLGTLAPRSLRDNHALVLDDSPALERIPGYGHLADRDDLEIERIVELADAETLTVRETARLTGYQAANLRSQLRTIEATDMPSAIQRWVAGRYADAEVTDYFVENVFDANYDLVVEIRYELPIRDDGKFDLPGFVESYYLEYDRVNDRRFPFEFYYPLRVSARTSVHVPAGRELAPGSKRPESAESRFGNWRRDVTVAEGAWEIRFDYEAASERFPPDQYREFADFQRDAIRGIELPVVLR
ncbi:MAG TPA: DUF3857 domain-containing protein [Woeseiaceae bacterium]|nr:DUF3857 domain-containing protein [Woeseiaceae bacterium]